MTNNIWVAYLVNQKKDREFEEGLAREAYLIGLQREWKEYRDGLITTPKVLKKRDPLVEDDSPVEGECRAFMSQNTCPYRSVRGKDYCVYHLKRKKLYEKKKN